MNGHFYCLACWQKPTQGWNAHTQSCRSGADSCLRLRLRLRLRHR